MKQNHISFAILAFVFLSAGFQVLSPAADVPAKSKFSFRYPPDNEEFTFTSDFFGFRQESQG
jgi:hypothetical protein